MKKLFYLAVFAVCINGCSSSPTNESVNMSANIRTNVDISELNNPNVNTQPNSNANSNANTEQPGVIFYDRDGKPVTVKKSEDTTPPPPIDPKAKPISVAAPDNSEITTTMNNNGQPVEIRTFKNNPTLAKVERVYVSANQPVVTVYFRDGKKADLTSAKIEDPMRSSADNIISAVSAVNADESQPLLKKQP